MDKIPTIGERIAAAQADVAYMQKGGKNAHFKYTFLQEAEVKREVGAALRKHGLFISHVKYEPIGECTGKNAVLICGVVISDGKDQVAFQGVGAGSDSSDKAPMKACAAALKYALTSGFLIATGDDPEDDSDGKDPVTPSADKPKMAPSADTKPGIDARDEALKAIDAVSSSEMLQSLKTGIIRLQGTPYYEEVASAYRAKSKLLSVKA